MPVRATKRGVERTRLSGGYDVLLCGGGFAGPPGARRLRGSGAPGLEAPLIVDALGWRRALGAGTNVQPPNARLSRGLEVHPFGGDEDLEIWIDPRYVPAGYGWSFPAADEVRIGVGSFDPRFHVKDT